MSATQSPATVALLEKNEFILRRLHSLTGIIPVGAFLVEHLLTNSMAWYGPGRYNSDVAYIQHLPYLFVLEWAFIFLPLAFHGLYGLWLALTASPNATVYPYLNNWRYRLQRITAYIALFFVVIHLFQYRFAYVMSGPVFAEAKDWFALTQQGLLHWQIGSFVVPAWFTLGFYVVGLTAAVYHFVNGLWTFGISWGILAGPESQRWFQYVCLLGGIVLCAWGYISLLGFVVQ